MSVMETVGTVLDVRTGEVLGGPGAGMDLPLLPSSVAWQGTTLEGVRLHEAVLRVAGALAGYGVGPESIVVLESDDTGRTAITLLALAQCGASVVLTDRLDRTGNLTSDTATRRIDVVLRELRSEAEPGPVDLRPVFGPIERGRRDLTATGTVDLGGWFARDRALGVFSSGTTTGRPELVWKSGPELRENAVDTARALDYSRHDVLLPLLPLNGQYGSSVVLIATVIGSGLRCCNRRRLGEVIRTIGRHGVTALDATPLLYQHLLDEIDRRPAGLGKLRSVRVFGVGGEGLHERLAERFRAVTGRPLRDGYGLTQLGNVAFAPASGGALLRPVDSYTVRVLDGQGREQVPGEAGNLVVGRSDGGPLAGAADGTWFDTGDLAVCHPEGIRILGRREMINRNGSLVPLGWVEARLADRGIEAYAVSVPTTVSHRFWLLVHDPLHRPGEQWRAVVDQALDPELRPDVVQVVGWLPTDDSGKVSRRRLQGLAAGLQSGRAAQRRDPATPLGRLRAMVLAHREEIMGLIAAYTDRRTAQHDYRAMMNILDLAQGELNLYGTPDPLPVDVFMPRNAVLESFAIYCLVPSLWASRVRVRPARGTESVVGRLVELMDDATGGRLDYDGSDQQSFVSEVAREPSVVLFTGLRRNAEQILERLSGAHLFLYFGRGVNPVVVFPGADLDRAAQEIVHSRLYNGGQDCLSPDLVLVHDSLAEDLVGRIARDAQEYVAGNEGPLAPLQKDETLLTALRYLMDHADGIVSGGDVDFTARTFSPAIVRIGGAELERPHEHFAPVFSVATFHEESEVDRLLDSEHYRENGFGVAVYGGGEELPRRLTGHYLVAKDQSLAAAIPPFEPFGGHGIESGYVAHRGAKRRGPINITQTVVHHGSTVRKGREG